MKGGSLVLALALAASFAAQQAPPAIGNGLIAGQVLDVTSGLPLSDITVSITQLGSRPPVGRGAPVGPAGPVGPVRSDSQGRFAFPSLPSGAYTLRAAQAGYAHVRGAFVTLATDERVTDVVLRAGRHGSIAGTVRDDAGDPVVGISVRTFNRLVAGFQPMLFPRGAGVTDDRGQFRIGDLPAGDYLVCACAKEPLPIDKDLLTRMASFTVPAASVAQRLDETVLTFAPTFHPGSTRVSGALPVTVGHGDDRVGITITMLAVRPVRVSGQLTGGGPTPGTSHKLALFPEDEDPAAIGISELEPVSVMADGAFTFAGVTPGRYSLEAYPADGGPGLTASASVAVGDRDLTGVVLSLTEGSTVRGHVEFTGVAARPDKETMTRARVGIVPLEMTVGRLVRLGTTGGIGHEAQLRADDTFTIEGVRPGRYRFMSTGLGAAWLAVESVRTGDGLSADSLVTVPSSGLDALVVTMSDVALATLQGTFVLDKHEWSNDSRVMMFPVDRSMWETPFAAPGRFASTGASNAPTFTFAGVPPGDYHVIVVDAGEAQPSSERFARWATRATTVTLRAGETTTVTLPRRPGL